MKKILMAMVAVMMLGLAGCVTSKGRVAVVDINFNSAEQNTSFRDEALCIYQDSPTNEIPVARNPATASLIIDIITAIKGRVRVLSVEWNVK